MYLKGAINADSIPTFSGGETRDTQSQHEGRGRAVLMFLSIKARDRCRPRVDNEAEMTPAWEEGCAPEAVPR